MCLQIDCDKVCFIDLLSCFTLELIKLLRPVLLEQSKDNNIKFLVDMCCVRWITEYVNIVSVSIV